MDDEFAIDAEFEAALAATNPQAVPTPAAAPPRAQQPTPQRIQQPTPQRIQQPTPQRLDKPPPSSSAAGKVVQPKPQALPSRSSGSHIQVSPRQRGNPVLSSIRSFAWEYSDIPADYVLGVSTCALFLSLKYHRLHPEYIYQRIRNLRGKYNLRILLTMVDIPNHEDSLRELSKTSLVNNATIILCWSTAEAARYLELYKSYEHANFSAIRGQQSSSYPEKLVDFVTVPRSVNKADAIALVSNFGTLKDAINADPAEVGIIAGWGTVKVNKWIGAVEEPFRAQNAGKRKLGDVENTGGGHPSIMDQAVPLGRVPLRDMPSYVSPAPDMPAAESSSSGPEGKRKQARTQEPERSEEDEETLIATAIEESRQTAAEESLRRSQPEVGSSSKQGEDLSGGIAGALAKLRDQG